jgi:hypothetical protein
LAKPAETLPDIFGDSVLFKEYPYLLPCLVGSSFSIFGVIIGYFFLGETLSKKNQYEPGSDSSNCIKTSPSGELLLNEEVGESTTTLMPDGESTPTSTFSVLTKDVIISIGAYAMWAFLNVIYDEVLALFVATPIISGGLSMKATELGMVMSALGVVQILVQWFCYSPIERSLGLVKTFRLSTLLMVLFSVTLPFINDVAKMLMGPDNVVPSTSRPMIFVLLLAVLTGRTIACCFGYVSVMIIVNDSCPDIRQLGLVNT